MLGGACLFKEGRWVFFVVVSGIWKLEAFLAERVEFLKPAEGGFLEGSVSSRGKEVFFFGEVCIAQNVVIGAQISGIFQFLDQ